ncbi:MAG: asparagine synthase (glutamine-hydrolyzing) [Defluviitaleaceae bacterium]|nr:asparagine synthase (glutamine-hydrolyzing) [Defluviitaleaceae bacterium]
MSGFCGFTGNITDKQVILDKMLTKIKHRGPDGSDNYIDEKIALGFNRLSFIDLSPAGMQPMQNEDNSLVMVADGLIYNYVSLREEMISKGHVFSSETDAEVLIHLYEEYGYEMLNMLRGMFSIVIYDKNKDEIFAARDFFGVKPFYYTVIDGNLVFASEIKSIIEHPGFKKEINEEALMNYLTFQYSVLPETFFKGVYKLAPAHYMIFKNGEIIQTRYFEIKFTPEKMGLQNCVQEINKIVLDSIELHKIGDAPVGSFLSSGVDSSYIAANIGDAKTFTVGWLNNEKYNEISYAKRLTEAKGIENYSKVITSDEYWDSFGKIQYHMDEPLADPSAVALYFASKLASEHVKGSMSGEGVDEFFGGYNIYMEPLDLKIVLLLPAPIRKFLGKLMEVIPFKFKGKNYLIRASKTVEERFIGNAKIFSQSERAEVLKNPGSNYPPSDVTKPVYDRHSHHDDVTKMQIIDLNFWATGDILLKADRMSMANSIEIRMPFLDKEVFKLASKLPTSYKVNRTSTKYAFRLAAKEHIPDETADKKKLGFPVPTRVWLREDKYYNRVKEAFESETSNKYFNQPALLKLLNEHKSGKKDNGRKIWTIYTFLTWHNEFFGEQ